MTSIPALVVLSGGQDSTTCLFWTIKAGYSPIHCISFDYGQAHSIELESAKKIAGMAGSYAPVTWEVISVQNILKSTSPLVDKTQPLERYSDAKSMDEIIGDRREKTFVPMRNALFLTIAANRAEAVGAKAIVTGICQADNANYDDCRETFREATEVYINKALGHDHRETGWIQVLAPLMDLSKAESVRLAYALPGAWDALAYSHTSYDGCYPPTDMNHANVLRADGFEKAGLPDPLVLRANREFLMALPPTANYDAFRSTAWQPATPAPWNLPSPPSPVRSR